MSAMQYGPSHVRALAPKRSVPRRAAQGAGTEQDVDRRDALILVQQAHTVPLMTLSYRGRVLF